MSTTIDINQLRVDIRLHCGTVTSDHGFDDPGCDLLANRSLWALMNKYPFREKESTTLFSTTAHEASYSLPVLFDALRQVSIEDPNSFVHLPLDRMSIFDYESVYVNESSSESAPKKYLRDGICLKLWPTPDDVYTIILKSWITLDQMDTANPDFPLPINWYEILLYGAVSRGYLLTRNTAVAADFKNQQASAITDTVSVEVKEEIDSHHSGVVPFGYEPDKIYD